MNNNYLNEKDINFREQADLLKEICTQQSVDYKKLVIMLEAEKIKKLHRKNHYINQVIIDVIED